MAAQNVAHISEADVLKLRAFHASHFVNQQAPRIKPTTSLTTARDDIQIEEDLGYYDDGVKRTLTDAEIAILRHSEIQRLLAGRRRQAAKEEEAKVVKKRAHATRKQIEPPRVFASDEVYQSQDKSVSLMYDEEEREEQPVKQAQTGKFLWPVLGQ